jgi:hypothetical protein
MRKLTSAEFTKSFYKYIATSIQELLTEESSEKVIRERMNDFADYISYPYKFLLDLEKFPAFINYLRVENELVLVLPQYNKDFVWHIVFTETPLLIKSIP